MSDAARRAIFSALKARSRSNVGLTDALCVFDLAQNLGVDVRFQALPSIEGFLTKIPSPVIFLSSLRPAGRTRFTCAHELGHLWLGHENSPVDETFQDLGALNSDETQEFEANMFGLFLLMPKSAVQNAFVSRGRSVRNCSRIDVFRVSNWLGVGYSTLITHMKGNLKLLAPEHAAMLMKHRPKDIASELLGYQPANSVTVVDGYWRTRPIDIEVGDILLSDSRLQTTGESAVLQYEPSGGKHVYSGMAPGICQVADSKGWSNIVRIKKRQYVGRSMFRHLEEPKDHD